MNSPNLENQLKHIEALVLDVDGVLTDGSIVYTDSGEEVKTFNVRDGLGIRMVMDAGIDVVIITGRRSGALAHRCKNLGITYLLDGIGDKKEAIIQIRTQLSLPRNAVACMGDDLPDIPMMKEAGVAIAVADAAPRVRQMADLVTAAPGGRGAVRETCERILEAKGIWEQAAADFLK